MDQPGPSRPKPEDSEPVDYSLEVVRLDVVRKLSKKRQPYVLNIKINNTSNGTIHIGDDGRPSSDAVLSFAQPGASSAFEISFRKSTNSDGHHLGHILIDEDVRRFLEDSIPYEFKRDLLGSLQRLRIFGKEKTITTGTISLRLDVTDPWKRAELCVSMAERQVEKIRAMGDKVSSPDSVIGTVIQAVDQIKEIVDTVAEIHPLVNLSWKAASALYNLVSHQLEADAKLVDLVDKMKSVFDLSKEARSLDDRNKVLLRLKIKNILDESATCSRFVQKYAARSFAGRTVQADSQKIDEFATRFVYLRDELNSVVVVGIGKDVNIIGKSVDNIGKGVDRIDKEVNNIASRQVLETLRTQLELTNMGISRVSTRPRCLEGTRKDYTGQIMSRLFPDADVDQSVVWLTGAAGAGKSTIAVTISDACDARGCPAAYLFFERGKDEYISAVRAIAYRVAQLYPTVLPHIIDAVEKNSNIKGSPIKAQFERLLLEPIQAAKGDIKRPIVIILDALDECGSSAQREDFVRVLTTDFRKLPSTVRVLITSRPENDILKHLSSKASIHRIDLEHTSLGSRRDVDSYIRETMMNAVGEVAPGGWEWDGICKVLSGAADGLFIWASTAGKMVRDSLDPQEELRTLLVNINVVGDFGLDVLYATVLKESKIFRAARSHDDQFRKILGLILFAKEAMLDESIEAFLNLKKGIVSLILGDLRSVISYEPDKPVRLHHASFADYLTSDRSSDKPWNIDESAQRPAIAERCLDIMNEKNNLRFNICSLESSFQRNDDIPDLQYRIEKAIPGHLDYACRFWSVHFCELSHPDSLLEKLETFASSKLLYWFEVLSLTKYYNRVAVASLYNASLNTAVSNFAHQEKPPKRIT